MNFSFAGRGEVYVDIDPEEWRGYSRDQIAAELHGLAKARGNNDYDSEQFYEAADKVLAAHETRSEGVRW